MHHCSFADSICLRFATHAFARLVSRALMKFGTAIASRMPMMSTTIMISTRVKPRRARFRNLCYIERYLLLSTVSDGCRTIGSECIIPYKAEDSHTFRCEEHTLTARSGTGSARLL